MVPTGPPIAPKAALAAGTAAFTKCGPTNLAVLVAALLTVLKAEPTKLLDEAAGEAAATSGDAADGGTAAAAAPLAWGAAIRLVAVPSNCCAGLPGAVCCPWSKPGCLLGGGQFPAGCCSLPIVPSNCPLPIVSL